MTEIATKKKKSISGFENQKATLTLFSMDLYGTANGWGRVF